MTTTATTTAVVRPLIALLIILSLQTTSLSLRGEDAPLIEFKTSLKDSTPLDSTWIAGTDPCDRKIPWLGVDCSDTQFKAVSSLLLINLTLSNNIGGLDVDALAKLESLRFLSLENNSFSGSIPEFNHLSSLKSLFLSGNSFSGEIPNDFFKNMGSLKKLELAGNNFSGKIPESLPQLDSLMEILLNHNHFSGSIPSFEQKSLKVVDFSHNNFDGEIPETMSRFPATAFQENPNVCGAAVKKPCNPRPTAPPLEEAMMPSGSTTKWVILAIVVAVLLVTIMFKKKDKNNNEKFTMIESESMDRDHVMQVHAPSINRRLSSTNRRASGNYNNFNSNDSASGAGAGGSKRGRSNSTKSNDLVMISEDKGMFGLPDLMKAAAEVLGNSGLGSAYKATMANGMSVVVKRMRGMNKLNKDAFDTEIRRLGRIRHRNILSPLAYHFRKEEKLLVSEFIPKGSLLFMLHGDRGIGHAELDWPTRLRIIKGVARGMGFLHTEFSELEVPHGNLKSSNILLNENHEPLLTDYSLYSLSSTAQSLQALQAYKCPEVAIMQERVSPKSDVYCLGIVILEMMTGRFPSQYLNNQNSGTDVVKWVREAMDTGRVAELIDPEIVANAKSSMEEMERMVHIGAKCTENDHHARIEMREAIRSIEEVQVR